MALHGRMLLLQLISLAAVLLLASSMLAAAQSPPPDCKETCGGVSIPYPFGLTDGCYLHVPGQDSQQFKLACDTTATSQPSLNFLDSYNFPTNISNIFAGESALQVMLTTSRNCYNDTVYNSSLHRASYLYLPPSYTLADKNKVYNIGCNKATKLVGYPLHVTGPEQLFEVALSGVSLCNDEFGKRFPETCTGFGCSVNSIPSGLQNITVDVWSLGTGLGTSAPWGLSYPCSYGFVVDERNFTFAGNRSFDELNRTRLELPVLASWAIGNDNCEAAKKKNETAFACKGENTECVDRAGGYFCQCWDGYEGNPYLLKDCVDVDECKNNSTLCSGPATCVNSIGSYKCKCHKGYRNDDNDKNKCVKINETSSKNDTEMKISLGVSLSFLVILIITFSIYCVLKRRKFKQLCDRYYEVNGGFLLPQEMQKYKGSQAPRIFKLAELNKATNKFDPHEIIGEGGFGLVYKGTLPDNKQVVAIKKSKTDAPTMTPESRIAHTKQFINEMIVLSGIKHRNVVTLLGCCLETKTPILVYELVSNGTLYEHIQKKKGKGPLSFGQRVKIAAETAGSLAYLHSRASSTPILHRDVKATNILLDENLTAKVSDFGASKLVPEDQNTQMATLVQGTLGYLDPEYIQTHKLTEKSDVYSFGVVLVELLTSQMAINSNKKLEEERNLANCFLMAVEDNHLDQILDHEIIKEESFEIAEQVAQLAQRCLSPKGGNRPTMIEVETEVGAILAVMGKHPGGKPDSSPNEIDYLLAASPSNAFVVDVRSDEGEVITSIDYDKSMHSQAQMMKPYDGGR
ncbi:PREDICTED: wall-associated receptor kinase 1-like isoform X1 [Fragaria vesca subsp. vesca]|uniref:wall-associated receptor kinase 1-like isoform X1 n=1 Tax=Fragaria vesca subsp. vesca TaxID=101020 RepID=UPI0002C31F84|nr:PREDICTED: wall-associated receptor kinase 1-like isoform X1 [Fragaria vesca subsp. vesca]